MHTIRLREPWLATWEVAQADASGVSIARSNRLANYERRFNRPSGLLTGQQVQLMIDSAVAPQFATLNAQAIAFERSGGRFQTRIDQFLETFNRLQLTFPHSQQLESPPLLISFAEVYLGIQDVG